jgi:hypothetical protein
MNTPTPQEIGPVRDALIEIMRAASKRLPKSESTSEEAIQKSADILLSKYIPKIALSKLQAHIYCAFYCHREAELRRKAEQEVARRKEQSS